MTDSKPQRQPDETPLHDFIDMEAYDVVSGERHRAALALLARVQPELAPNHAEADELRRKFGLGGSPSILDEISEFLEALGHVELAV
jgi:hypothetical protein